MYYEKGKDKVNIENVDIGEKFNKLEFGLVVFYYFFEFFYCFYYVLIKCFYG